MDCGSLESVLIRAGKHIPSPQLGTIGLQSCEGLKHLHLYNIVHRDLKPGNMLANRYGAVKLADFGIAKDVRIMEARNALNIL